MPMNAPLITNERDGLLAFLDHQRQAIRNAAYGLTDDQARMTPTPSTLSVGGLIKHLVHGEHNWSDRIEGVPPGNEAFQFQTYMGSFVLGGDDTLTGVLQQYGDASARTDAIVGASDDLGRRIPLPQAPWYPDPDRCTLRWILFHLIEETARHAGHADIIREALDGAMGGSLMAAAEGWPADGWIKPWRPAD